MKFFFSIFILTSHLIVQSQNWAFVGDTMASDSGAAYPFLAINNLNEPYIVYYDCSTTAGGTAVKKFNGNQWVKVGQNPSTGWVGQTVIAFDNNSVPYVALGLGKLTVKKFDGSTWSTVGNPSFTPDQVTSISFKIAANGTPYVAFRDFQYNQNASVMKFDGANWVYVGQPGFSPNASQPYKGAIKLNLAVDQNNNPVVAFVDITNGYRISVMKYTGNNWIYVGSPNISGPNADYPSLVLDKSGNPIISYSSGGNIYVKKFDGTNWVAVGQAFGSSVDFLCLAIDKDDRLFIGFTQNQYANAMMYNGSSWAQAGNALFSPNQAVYTTLGVDNQGILYTAFQDGKTRFYPNNPQDAYNIVSVMRLQTVPTKISEYEVSSFLLNVFPNPTKGKVQINYSPRSQQKATLKIMNIHNDVIFVEELNGAYNREFDLTKYSKGIYFVEITSEGQKIRKKVILD